MNEEALSYSRDNRSNVIPTPKLSSSLSTLNPTLITSSDKVKLSKIVSKSISDKMLFISNSLVSNSLVVLLDEVNESTYFLSPVFKSLKTSKTFLT